MGFSFRATPSDNFEIENFFTFLNHTLCSFSNRVLFLVVLLFLVREEQKFSICKSNCFVKVLSLSASCGVRFYPKNANPIHQ